MTPDEAVDRAFLDGIGALAPQPQRAAALPLGETTSLTGTRCLEIFGSQLASRHLDLAARVLRGEGRGCYTIGSAGNEANTFVAGVLRLAGPALLHHRSGAFFAERARQVPGQDPIRDTLLGVVAAADEPIAGGRHKVFGSESLSVIPQTSTIGPHLPAPSGSRSRSNARPASACPPAGRRMPSSPPASATPPPTIPRRPVRSTRPVTAPISVFRCRCRCCCCWSARTTGSGSASAPRRAGSTGQFRNPAVIRVASYGYQEGFGRGQLHPPRRRGPLRARLGGRDREGGARFPDVRPARR